jgi:NhaA family Na+:H+ antiporter
MRRVIDPLREFLREEAAGGIVLVVAAAAALVWVNSPAGESYTTLWTRELTLGFGDLAVTEDLQHWVNDGLMVIFFFVVGLEIKRELATGELRDRRAAVLPAVAAVGGVLVPAVIFLAWTWGSDAATGWGIPMATDIAFAVGVMALLGSRAHSGSKLFLLTIAIVDDIIAITVIALVYSDKVSAAWLSAAVLALALVVVLQRLGVGQVWPYLLVGVVVWFCTLESGVHATIAGVALGLLTPAGDVGGGRYVLRELEHRLHPWSAFLVIPLFALANAGVVLSADSLREAATSSLALGIASGLVVGKLFGISGATFLMLRLGWGALPAGVDRRQVWGVAAVAGIGFTVSLFIADLAFEGTALVDIAKIGIFAGSLLAGAVGAAIMVRASRPAPEAMAGRAARD